MSESLGLKAVSRVDETDRLPFLKALAHIAVIDDSVDLDEKRMVEQYADAWNLDAGSKSQVQEILDTRSSLSLNQLVAEFSESGTRFLLMQELMRLGYADGTYGEAERKEIASIAQRMGMSEDQFREVEKWVGRGQAWDAAEDEGPSEDDLQNVLNRDEEDPEHDLSDIQTGDSDLSDLDDADFSEIDEEEFKKAMEDDAEESDDE